MHKQLTILMNEQAQKELMSYILELDISVYYAKNDGEAVQLTEDGGMKPQEILLYQKDEMGFLPKAFETQEKMYYPWIQVISGYIKENEKYFYRLYLNNGYSSNASDIKHLKTCFDAIQKWVRKRGTPVPGWDMTYEYLE